MWISVGTGSNQRRKKDGRILKQPCPQCNQFTTLHEVEVVEHISVFFVPVMTKIKEINPDHNPPFECEKCGGTFLMRLHQHAPLPREVSALERFLVWFWRLFNPTPEKRAKTEAKRKAQEEKRKAQGVEADLQRLKREMQNNQKGNR